MQVQTKYPAISNDPLYQFLREKNITQFNKQRGDSCDFSNLDFRNVDLRGFDLSNVNFSNCYFKGGDLRGLDFRTCNLQGASLHNAHVAGAFFPSALDPNEILLSIKEGTRMRYISL